VEIEWTTKRKGKEYSQKEDEEIKVYVSEEKNRER
jgi:hypothetical protein